MSSPHSIAESGPNHRSSPEAAVHTDATSVSAHEGQGRSRSTHVETEPLAAVAVVLGTLAA